MRITTKYIIAVSLLLGVVAIVITLFWSHRVIDEPTPDAPVSQAVIPEPPAYVPPVKDDVLYTSPLSESVLPYRKQAEPSTVSIKIALPLARIKSQAEQSTPRVFEGAGDGPEQCANMLGIKKCVGTRYQYRVRRGDIKIEAAANNSLRLSIPLTITGVGGLSGAVAEFLSLDAKEFRAQVAAFANVGLTIGANWCPKVRVSPGYQWVERAKVEIVSGVWIDIADEVESAFKSQLHQLSGEFAKAVRCDDVQREINRLWAYRSVPVQAVQDARFINVAPKKLGYSGMRISPDAVNIFLMLTFNADLATNSLQQVLPHPPPMNSVKYENGLIRLHVPFTFQYSALREKLSSQLFSGGYNAITDIGTARVFVHQVELYPSNKQLVFSALITLSILGTDEQSTGWIYWTATPSVRKDGSGIRLHTITLSPTLDAGNESVVRSVFNSVFLPVLTRYELTEFSLEIASSGAAIAAGLTNLQSGADVNIQTPTLLLQRVIPLHDQFLIEGKFRSLADINYSVI